MNDFEIRLEEDGFGGTFVHCDVYRYSPSVKREILREWNSIKQQHSGKPLFALHYWRDHKDLAKHLKFLKLFGFELIQTIPFNGEEADLYVCLNGYGDANAEQTV